MNQKDFQIKVTEAASEHFKRLLSADQANQGVFLGLKSGGCAGLSYVIELQSSLGENQFEYCLDDVTYFIDAEHAVYLHATEIDFVQNGLNRALSFKNPNTANECGCGESVGF